MEKEPVHVFVIGAAGNIRHALVHRIAMGGMLGLDQPVILHVFDIPPAAEALNEVKMELEDAASPLLRGVVATTDVVEACTGVNIAIMLGGFPGEEGMERQDVMSQASALEQHAAANCKVLAVANFADTNALFENEFAPPTALFVASSACDHMRDWFLGTPEGTWVPRRVKSYGSHNVPAGLICSFPVTCRNGEWTIVQGLSIDELSWKKCLQTMILGMILIFLFIIYSLLRGTLY